MGTVPTCNRISLSHTILATCATHPIYSDRPAVQFHALLSDDMYETSDNMLGPVSCVHALHDNNAQDTCNNAHLYALQSTLAKYTHSLSSCIHNLCTEQN